ncbi:prohead protease/major capsid protein fusion protein [Blastochloris tepida]|uniref:Prohead serine protease domain-containing protein n=1 Tax=Blastochloris tepida TaxID=2233851 RepID=A0A348G5S9_9HYPH|nr:prohead protease/major capsid protein fusion protein [Blastochloris tepida]BBF94912.1 hypothetical protein BLTE_35970 [Blastochloris tepida]
MNAPAFVRAAFTPSSVDDDARTAELIAATGAGVDRADFDGPFREVLEISERAVDLSHIEGMPLLDNHNRRTVDDIKGAVRGGRIEAGQLILKVEFSPRAEDVFQDVKRGIIRNVSVGYAPETWRDSTDQKGARVRTITRWALHEVSLVPVGADPNAKVRNMPETTPTTDAPPPNTTTPAAVTTRAAANQEIRALATTFDLGSDWANDLIDRGASEGEARAAALEAMRTRQSRPAPAARVTVGFSNDDPAQLVTRMGEALYATRANPRHQLSEPARPYANLTTLDMARECLRARGFSTTGLNPVDTITRALHTTSDFPAIFGDTANRVLRAAYQAAPAVLKRAARQTSHRDFRAKTRIQVSEAPSLEKVHEAGEFKYGTFAEAKESYKVDTFGKIFGISRQALVNDDLGAFTDVGGKFGLAAAEFEGQFLVSLLVQGSGLGPTMDDAKRLFHTDHGNLASSGAALSETTLDAARLAMRRQKGLTGSPVNVAPRFLLVPPELETDAEKLLAQLQPIKTEDVNPFGGKLELLVEARLTDAYRWYVVGDPAVIEGLEYAYLQGSEGPQTETRAGFEVDGMEFKVRLDFGAAFLDHRGWYTNAGH